VSYARKAPNVAPFHNHALLARTSQGGPTSGAPVVIGSAPKVVKASKGARELAKKRGLKLEGILGTGDHGSITIEDVRRASGGI
jgi:pyruvate/2-oxoglutarate dehydrogenase complex dihydrolipoamide acyltransferase (E2) component